MQETTLFWGILVASLTNVLCLCAYLRASGPWWLAEL